MLIHTNRPRLTDPDRVIGAKPAAWCNWVFELLGAGERDTFTPPWLSLRMQQLLPNSDLLMVPGGSHTAPIEIPELIHLRLRSFLENRIAPPKSRASKKKAKKAIGKKAKAAKTVRRRKRAEG